MKIVYSALMLLALSVTSCAHHGQSHEGRDKAGKSCCKEKKDCKNGSCKLKKSEKKADGCCSKKAKK